MRKTVLCCEHAGNPRRRPRTYSRRADRDSYDGGETAGRAARADVGGPTRAAGPRGRHRPTVRSHGDRTARGYSVVIRSFIALQTLAMVGYLVSGHPATLPLVLILFAIWVIGMLLPQDRRKLQKSLMFLAISTAVLGLGITLLQKMTSGSVNYGWVPNLPFFLLLEGFAIWAGIRMESWSGTIRMLLDSDPTPNV